MAEVRYANLHQSPSARVQTNGTQPGPPLGDNWTQAAVLPSRAMPSGPGEYAVVVTGKYGEPLVSGAAPVSGVMQVCLGTTAGTRLPHMRSSHPLAMPLHAREGMPFQFLLIVSSGYPDPVLGSSFTPSAGFSELCLWARTYLNGDPQAYYAEFTLADVSWLWFDLARIPSTDWLVNESTAQTAFPNEQRYRLQELSPAVGLAGETWLHFANFWYEPRQHLANAPRMRIGLVEDGIETSSLSCTVTTIVGGARITTAPNSFDLLRWNVGNGCVVTGSALGTQGQGGNNSPPDRAQRLTARASDGSWIEVAGNFVNEGPVQLNLTSWPIQTKLGSSGSFGLNRYPAAGILNELPQVQLGGFWPWTNTFDRTRVGYDAWENQATGSGVIMKRWRHLAIRIDTLPEVRTRSEQGPNPGGVRLSDSWRDYQLTVERPAPDPGILVEPIVMLQQFGFGLFTHGAFGSRVRQSSGGRLADESLFSAIDPTRNEAVPATLLGRRIFQTTSPAMQWLCYLVGTVDSPPGIHNVYDFHFVTFHPVRDPENITDPPGSAPAPIVLVPGKQGPAPENLPVPPTEPNANPLELARNTRPQIRGGTGYRRSWPLGAKPLRQLSVIWGPLTEDAAQAVFEFLRDNPIWRYTPPKSAALAAMSTSRPEMVPASHRSFSVSIEVAILVWTGA